MNRPIKKLTALLLLAVLTLCGLCLSAPQQAAAQAPAPQKVTYAYLPADTVLYRVQDDQYTPLVVLPKTYFVALLEPPAEGEYLFVSYLDLTGYVLLSAVELCDYTPVYKYASLTASPDNDGLPVNLRDRPDHQNGSVLTTLPPDSTLTLYGSVAGSALIPAVGSMWHYVKYTQGDVSTYGYVYAGHLRAQTPEPNRIEKMPEEPADSVTELEPAPPRFTTGLQIAFIVALSLPAVVVMLLLFRKKPDARKAAKVPRNYREP